MRRDLPGHDAQDGARPTAAPALVTREPLQVRLPVAVKRRFRSHAALRGIEPNESFVEVRERCEASLAGMRPEEG